jgi:thiamine kinase-like enzyme
MSPVGEVESIRVTMLRGNPASRRPYDQPIAALPPPLPEHGPIDDFGWLDATLTASTTWGHGTLQEATATRIGADFGFGGIVHRIDAVTTDEADVSLVVKREVRGAIERALSLRDHHPGPLKDIVPTVYGSLLGDEHGVLVLEYVHPITQGDVLAGCTDDQAESVIRRIARIHAASMGTDRATAAATWKASEVEQAMWETKLAAAAERHPDILDDTTAHRLTELPAAVRTATEALGRDEWSWIHADLHLDNVVFRDGESAVILDWADARIGPPAIDIGHILTEGLDRGRPAERIDRWCPVYADEAARFGVTVDLDRLRTSIGWSVLPLLRGVIGWASSVEDFVDRLVDVRANLLRNCCEWLDTGIIPIEI